MKSNGKNICAVLKQVRQRVADANGIVYRPKECHFEGDCDGTCPTCEAEVRLIESQLGALRLAGKAVKVAGLALGIGVATGCNSPSGTHPAATDRLATANEAATASKADTQPQENAHNPAGIETHKPNAQHRHIRRNLSRVIKNGATFVDTTAIYMADSLGKELPEVQVVSKPSEKKHSIAGGIPCVVRIVRNRQHVYLNPDIAPRYKKGEEAMKQFIDNNIRLAPGANAAGDSLVVKVACVVERNGRLTAMRVIKSLGVFHDDEALRVVRLMPRWRPARTDRKRVRSLVVIDVWFK